MFKKVEAYGLGGPTRARRLRVAREREISDTEEGMSVQKVQRGSSHAPTHSLNSAVGLSYVVYFYFLVSLY